MLNFAVAYPSPRCEIVICLLSSNRALLLQVLQTLPSRLAAFPAHLSILPDLLT